MIFLSGHSHWAGIKHRKAAQDAKKGVAFQKLIKDVIAAAKAGGGDPNSNFRLKVAIDRARAGNVPVDNIERVPHGSKRPSIDGGFSGFCPLWMYRIDDGTLRCGYSRKQCGFSLDEEAASKLLARMFPRKGSILVPEGFVAVTVENGRSAIVLDNRTPEQLAEPVPGLGLESIESEPDCGSASAPKAPVRLESGLWHHEACLVCGNPFDSKSKFSKYCCRDHKKYAYYHPEEFPHTDGARSFGEAVCPECGKTFTKHTTMQTFCTPACQKVYASKHRDKKKRPKTEEV